MPRIQFGEYFINVYEILSGAPCKVGHEIRRRKSEGGAGIHFPHTPFSSRPARAKIIKSQRPDFRGKKFGFHSGDIDINFIIYPCTSSVIIQKTVSYNAD